MLCWVETIPPMRLTSGQEREVRRSSQEENCWGEAFMRSTVKIFRVV